MKTNVDFHPDLLLAQEIAYKPNGLVANAMKLEKEGKEYGACTLKINDKIITFRAAKITPTKKGQFVTLWKRIENGPILPYDMTDTVDLFVISVRNEKHFGQFIFPKNVLHKKGYVSKDKKSGKRAIRIYPPWDTPNNLQANKSQIWQLQYFVEFQPNIDATTLKRLFL